MDDAENMQVREGWLLNLRKALELLCLEAEEQVRRIQELQFDFDELGLSFADAFAFFRPRLLDGRIDLGSAAASLQRIDELLLDIAAAGDPAMWTPAGIRDSPKWQAVRTAACQALAVFPARAPQP